MQGQYTPAIRIPVERRFWPKVDKNGPLSASCPELGPCWVWTSKIHSHGYGLIGIGDTPQKYLYAHRISYEMAIGPIPEDMEVCHRCDNPPCVRPSHLYLGTHAENMRDASLTGRFQTGDQHWSRRMPGRMPRGERKHNAKLTDDDVREIRRLCSAGLSQRAIAAQFGVTQSIVSEILNSKRWAHVV